MSANLDVHGVVEELTERHRHREDPNVATMTVVVYFDDASVAVWARDRTQAVAGKHRCRVVILDATQGDELRHVAADEWIELGVKDSDPRALASAMAALQLRDVPVVLFWIAAGIHGDARFTEMAERVRTVVYNSSVLDPGDAALRDLLTFAQEQPNVAVDDVAYLRLAPWQDSIALFFDGKDTMQELFDLRRVEIACGSDPEAYYLLGWLASRLEWTPCAERQFCNRFGTQIDFTIARDGPPRRIRRVSLASSTTTFVAETDGPDAQAISLTVTGAIAHSPRFHPLTNIDLASLVERAILTGHDDRVFRASLAAAGTILAQKGST